jgi:hypothetical protein
LKELVEDGVELLPRELFDGLGEEGAEFTVPGLHFMPGIASTLKILIRYIINQKKGASTWI